jgi:hypothetical protein
MTSPPPSIPAAELTGLYVLLMVIPLDAPRDVYFFVGTAVWDRRSIYLIDDGEQRLVRIPVTAEALVGGDPSTLPNVLLPGVLAEISPLIAEIEAYVPVFAASAPAGASAYRNAFFGLARGQRGEPVLVQGDPMWDSSE